MLELVLFIYDLQKSYTDLQNLYNSLKQALQKVYIINLVRKTNKLNKPFL